MLKEITAKDFQRYKGKTVSGLIKIATRHFNKYIRLRDSSGDHFQCISCQKIKSMDKCHAGHYFNSTKSSTRFDPLNVHAQCSYCNTYQHGNLADYERNLRAKIGDGNLDLLRSKSYQSKKWDKFELVAIIETYKVLVKSLEAQDRK